MADVEGDEPAAVHPGRDLGNDAGLLIIDRVGDRGRSNQRARLLRAQVRHQVAHLQRCRFVIEHQELRRGQHLHGGDSLQRLQHHVAAAEIDSEREPTIRPVGGTRVMAGDDCSRLSQSAGKCVVGEIELCAVLQRVVQIDFGDDDVDAHLQWQDVDLVKHGLYRRFLLAGGIDQDRIVLRVWNDAHGIGARPPGAAAVGQAP